MIPPRGAREDGVDGLPKEAASAEQPPSPASTGSQESKVPRALVPREHELTVLLFLPPSTFVSSDLALAPEPETRLWTQEQNAKPSSFPAGNFLVLRWTFPFQFVCSLHGQLFREPNAVLGVPVPGFPALSSSCETYGCHEKSERFDLFTSGQTELQLLTYELCNKTILVLPMKYLKGKGGREGEEQEEG
ncbi:SH3 and cysteine-rich domain-containing protein [Galemys pyrenaicus]|uniref:SH3 and cysteine-rich domain-containing protein n=1 Tax=Galemys pyrenaicus TaxID=202257 RepID=A0A8J6ANE5_GALPY|nr:SH3 and cysteine-rich domain-containing protein [Galemys pyrenaicus]